jgi:hypothetical protein
MLSKLTFALVSALLVASCATTTGIGGTEAACSIWRPISWSQQDTDRTIEEAKLNNARRAVWCKA